MILAKSHYVKAGNRAAVAAVALRTVAAHAAAGDSVGEDLCLANVRKAYGAPGGIDTAYLSWVASGKKPDATHTYYDAPAGVPVFWSGGSHGAGHVAIADGKGNVWSTDIRREGKWDLVPISEIHAKWGLKYLGWAGRINGVTVYL